MEPTHLVRERAGRWAMLALAAIAGCSFGELHARRHPGPPPIRDRFQPDHVCCDDDAGAGTPRCDGTSCPLRPGSHAQASDAPVFRDLEFVTEGGGRCCMPYDRLTSLSVSAPGTTIVCTFTLDQVVVEGCRLEPLYWQLQHHEIGYLAASALDRGETYHIPVVPLAVQGRRSASIPAPAPSVTFMPVQDGGDDLPVVIRVRVIEIEPYHYGAKGEYVADG